MFKALAQFRPGFALAAAGAILSVQTASANPLRLFEPFAPPAPQVMSYAPVAAPIYERTVPPAAATAETQVRFQRQVVDYATREAPGTIVIDTPNTYLYLVLGNGKAMRYGIGVGREGFAWAGTKHIDKKAEWPDWTPPAEMLERQPYLPRFMAGGPGNPMGARAMYLAGTVYRIHGTNQPETIGGRVSSGCIRMVNDDVIDLYNRVKVGAKVVVLPIPEHRVVARTVR